MSTWKSGSKKKRKASKSPADGAAPLAALDTPPTADEAHQMQEARAKALDVLGFELRAKELVEAFKRTSGQADTVRLRVLESTQEKPACKQGCSWCCSHKVGVTVPEVLAVVEHLRASPERLEIVRQTCCASSF